MIITKQFSAIAPLYSNLEKRTETFESCIFTLQGLEHTSLECSLTHKISEKVFVALYTRKNDLMMEKC